MGSARSPRGFAAGGTSRSPPSAASSGCSSARTPSCARADGCSGCGCSCGQSAARRCTSSSRRRHEPRGLLERGRPMPLCLEWACRAACACAARAAGAVASRRSRSCAMTKPHLRQWLLPINISGFCSYLPPHPPTPTSPFQPPTRHPPRARGRTHTRQRAHTFAAAGSNESAEPKRSVGQTERGSGGDRFARGLMERDLVGGARA